MTELVGACVASTVLLTIAVVDALRSHGRALSQLHDLELQENGEGLDDQETTYAEPSEGA